MANSKIEKHNKGLPISKKLQPPRLFVLLTKRIRFNKFKADPTTFTLKINIVTFHSQPKTFI